MWSCVYGGIGGCRTRSSVLALSSQPDVADSSQSYKVVCSSAQHDAYNRAEAFRVPWRFLGVSITCYMWAVEYDRAAGNAYEVPEGNLNR